MANILIFEDDYALASHWKCLLEAANHQVRCCDVLETAMNLIEEDEPDLIIADMLIRQGEACAGDGGLTLLVKLRLSKNLGIPIIGVSGLRSSRFTEVTALDAAENMGIDMALYKPISPEQLLDATNRLLEKSNTAKNHAS